MEGFDIGFGLTNGGLQIDRHLRGGRGKLGFGNQEVGQRSLVKVGGQGKESGIAGIAHLIENNPHAGSYLRSFGGGGALLKRGPGTGFGIGIKLHDEKLKQSFSR